MTTSQRVLARFLISRWDNAINAKFFEVHWNRAKWHVEEMADGSPMPNSMSFTEKGPARIAWEFPQLGALLSKFNTRIQASPEILRNYIKFPFEASGTEARERILEGSENFLREGLAGLRNDPASEIEAERFERIILPQVKRKLTWKKV